MNFCHTTDSLVVLSNLAIAKDDKWSKYLQSSLGSQWSPSTLFPLSKTLIDPIENYIYSLDVAVNLCALTLKKVTEFRKFQSDHYPEIVRFLETSIKSNGYSSEISDLINYRLFVYLPSTVEWSGKLNASNVTKTIFGSVLECPMNEYVKEFRNESGFTFQKSLSDQKSQNDAPKPVFGSNLFGSTSFLPKPFSSSFSSPPSLTTHSSPTHSSPTHSSTTHSSPTHSSTTHSSFNTSFLNNWNKK